MSYIAKSSVQTKFFNYSCESKSECFPQSVTLHPGRYIFELFGASGGGLDSNEGFFNGGKGGFSSIIYETNKIITLYLYIGGEGSFASTPSPGGWNGGGSSTNYGCSGGGATDIRLKNCSWYEEECLNERIVVAAGGGGAYGGDNCKVYGSDGGGEIGGHMGKKGSGCTSVHKLEKPCTATQDKCINGDNKAVDGKLGRAGNCTVDLCSGGGGGYYGGGSGLRASSGGSSYIPTDAISAYTKSGVNTGNGYISISTLSLFICTKSNKHSINLITLFIIISYKHT